jgi:hypothetical protein
MAIVDVHQHLWPAEVVERLAARADPPCLRDGVVHIPGRAPFPLTAAETDTAQRLALLDRLGIDRALVSLSPTDRFDEELGEAWHAGIVRVCAESGGRLAALAADRPRAGFAGVCVAADRTVAGLGDLAGAGLPLFVHPAPSPTPPAGAPSWWSGGIDYAAQMQAAYAAWLERDAAGHPEAVIVFAILAGGAPLLEERWRARGASLPQPPPGVLLDTASFGPRALGFCATQGHAARLVFGTDAPVLAADPALAAVRDLAAGEQVLARGAALFGTTMRPA